MMRLLISAGLSIVVFGGCAAAEDGARQFATRCAGCHGGDGRGGEHGPNIVDSRRFKTTSKDDLRKVIREGIPGGGMPAFPLPAGELDSLVAFLLSQRAPAAENNVPGDAAAGRAFFYGNGNCSQCHIVQGRGGILGPELSNLAKERTVGQIRDALLHPGDSPARASGYQAVTLRLRNGRNVRGILKNESNYDLQIQDAGGNLRSFSREEIAGEHRESKSIMPAVTASGAELENLIAFLCRLSRDTGVTEGPVEKTASDAFSRIAHPAPGDWPTYNGRLSGNRHSELRQIDTSNAAKLAPRWIFSMPGVRRLEVTPVVVDGVMYVTNANEAFALDARTGMQIWHYSRLRTPGLVGDAAGGINRGVAILGDRLFMVTDNAHLLALNRIGGQLLWDVEMADYHDHYGATSAPLVVKDLVLSGTSGGDEGARGFIAAYRASTGERVWRVWTMPAPGEPLSETWRGKAIEHGCATAWLTGTYDAAANLIYWTTGNPCPDYNGDERQGDNLYSSSVLAMDPEGGNIRWHYQFTPHDVHDWDAVQTPVLVEAELQGRPRQLLVQANRNGFFYELDRVTGKLLLARPFIKTLTWASAIGADGRPQLLPGQEPTPQGTRTCPSVVGATNWMSTAYNPATGLFYVMALESCGIYTKSPEDWERGRSYYGGTTRDARSDIHQKFLRAIDIQSGNIAWEYPQIGSGDTWGGVLSTAGGLVFFCDDSGAFAALDARTGKPLWHFNTSLSWHASPMTYTAGGKQFIAVAVGSNVLAFAIP